MVSGLVKSVGKERLLELESLLGRGVEDDVAVELDAVVRLVSFNELHLKLPEKTYMAGAFGTVDVNGRTYGRKA